MKQNPTTSNSALSARDDRMQRLGRELQGVREQAGLTQGQLARRIGKSTATVSKIEAAKQRLDMPTFLAITDELRVAPEQVLLRVEMSRKPMTRAQRQVVEVFRKLVGPGRKRRR